MAKFVIIYHTQNPQRLDAESVTYDGDDGLFVFRDADRKPVAWAPKQDVLVVAQAPVVGSP
ncbi:hypothetical protein ACIQVR_40885 [Streptomyces xanthochromogenes]|uniref:hypothetical protein n=1 Tax=Streptomyces xanthochromogenes TaxID=67384 RepID=UPI00380ABF02